MTKITVLGAGSWGTVLASLLSDNGHEVLLYGNNQEVFDEIAAKHTNTRYLAPEFKVNETLELSTDLEHSVTGRDLLLFVLPTKAIRSVGGAIADIFAKTNDKPLLASATKGIEPGTKERVSQILLSELYPNDPDKIVIISGPSHAEGVAQKDLTALSVASSSLENAKIVQKIFSNQYLRLYTNSDVIGVEVGGAAKNVIAVGAGILHGKGFGDNAKAALMTRGLAEMTRLGVAMGAEPLTFSGLSGIGDLIVTCTSTNSRNWRAGNALAQGKSLDQTLKDMGMIVEGVLTAKALHELSADLGVEMPISEAIYRFLYENSDIDLEISRMMGREAKPELEF